MISDIPGRPGRFYGRLKERLKKFGLEIAEDKSRIMPYGKFKGTKESFNFLGFTHYNATSHWGKTRPILLANMGEIERNP